MKTLVVIPTYNEADSIEKILNSVLKLAECDVLIVDDNSTDGTADIVKKLFNTSRIHMIERPSKLGLGTAYTAGFKWGLKRDYDLFFEMDADLSHDPSVIPDFVKKVSDGFDLVIGSRYLHNTISVVGWDFKRMLLSKFGNWYASTLLGIKQFTDLTSGYRCYTKKALIAVNLDAVKSNGYAFQIEMVYRAYKAGVKAAEIPIIFYERHGGSSKMNRQIVREAVLLPFKLRLHNLYSHNMLK